MYNIKKSSILLVAVMVILACSSFVKAAGEKIAVVDMELIMNAYPETKSSRLILEQQLSEFEKEQQGMLEDRKTLEEKFKAAGEKSQNSAFSKEVREKNRILAEGFLQDLRKMENDIRETANLRRKQLSDRQLRMRRRIVTKLREIVKGYCEKNDISLVLDSASPEAGNAPESVVYSNEKLDITDAILKLIGEQTKEDK